MLTVDSVAVTVRALTSLFAEDPEVLRVTFRRGEVYNNETRGIQCKADWPVPWVHGPAIIRHLKQVRRTGHYSGVFAVVCVNTGTAVAMLLILICLFHFSMQ